MYPLKKSVRKGLTVHFRWWKFIYFDAIQSAVCLQMLYQIPENSENSTELDEMNEQP